MTRTARRGPENKKKHEASDWNTLRSSCHTPSTQPEAGLTARARSDKRRGQASNKMKGPAGKARMKGKDILHTVLAKEQRREQRRQRRIQDRETKKRCFKCRLPGHRVEECMMGDTNSLGTGICYRCGSTEHKASLCKAKGPKDAMPYASCYVCGKQGHLARSCPDNPRGLYPSGGGCRTCGSVEHFQRDCPEYLAKQGIGSQKLSTISEGSSADAEDTDRGPGLPAGDQPTHRVAKKKKPKVIKF
ncbi:uncharacterized protein LOC143297356 [Babylonia areolata]|uniref:uncharacterized protein LOC143297356 n=1 Tax=Babylonia areolata TaxID=304850 RepID=UPI003FD3AA9D